MKFLIKKIRSQEWGYRRGLPNMGGKYLLIPIKDWNFFPDLSNGIRNSFSTIRILLPNDAFVGLFYVWNNTKLFPEMKNWRAHNERRLYSSKDFEKELGLDSETILILLRVNQSNTDYIAYSINKSDREYNSFEKILGSNSTNQIEEREFKELSLTTYTNIIDKIKTYESLSDNDVSLNNAEEFLEEAKRKLKHLGETVEILDDPLSALSSSFKTQSDFSNAVRKIYNGRCALRGSYIYRDYPIGLEAAHIHAKYNGGNFLPSNGILLSTDLHRAFDEGVWTLSDNHKVIIHDEVKDGILAPFSGNELLIPNENASFRPYVGYIKWHRENRFGSFLRLK